MHRQPVFLFRPQALLLLRSAAGLPNNAAVQWVILFQQPLDLIAQLDPLAHSGTVPFRANIDDTITRDFGVNVQRIQLEQDTGKAYFHSDSTTPLVDLNRCGVALIEIVTRPDMQTPSEAVAFVKKLRSILRAIDVCNGNMEEASGGVCGASAR